VRPGKEATLIHIFQEGVRKEMCKLLEIMEVKILYVKNYQVGRFDDRTNEE
jgi:hypothetical protein